MQPTDSQPPTRPTNEQVAHAIYPEARAGFAAGGLPSQASIVAEQAGQAKKKRQFVVFLCLAIAVLAGIIGWLFWSAGQDHSAYANLTSEQYSQNGVSFGFMYPKMLTSTNSLAAQNASIKVAFLGGEGSDRLLIDAGANPIGQILQELQISPTTLLSQLEARSGSFVNKLRSANAGAYDAIYGHCMNYLVTTSGQKDVLCAASAGGYTNVLVVGADTNNQYTLQLYMTTHVWTSHQDLWRKVEKSFRFD